MHLKDDFKKEEYYASLKLIHTRGLGYKRCKVLLDFYGSAVEAVKNVKNWTRNLSFPAEVVKEFLKGSWKELVYNEFRSLEKSSDIGVLLYSDPLYPSVLKEISDPPLYLYYFGNIDLINNSCIAVVGSRICSEYGRQMAFSVSRDLSSCGITVVSGFAIGIDREAHLGGLEERGRSIAILGCGLDIIYPSRNKDLWQILKRDGLIVSEFPLGTPPEAMNFPKRNRIISGISLGIVVIEAREKSGSFITAKLGIEQGKTVFAVPASARSSYQGTNKLIREGAVLVVSAEDVIEEIPFLLNSLTKREFSKDSSSKDLSLSDDEKDVYEILKREEKLHIDEISKKLNWSSCKASEILLLLELKGVVVQLPGMCYSLKVD